MKSESSSMRVSTSGRRASEKRSSSLDLPVSRRDSFTITCNCSPTCRCRPNGQTALARGVELRMTGVAGQRGDWGQGIFENQTVLEDGVWKISGMDLDCVWICSYRGRWARVGPNDSRRFAPSAPPAIAPDRPLRGVQYAPFPSIAEMGFHYANPVSGRAPALLLP